MFIRMNLHTNFLPTPNMEGPYLKQPQPKTEKDKN